MTEARKQVDWEKVEGEYRAGILSVREIAVSAGVSHTAINKKAKAQGWDRDLSAKIKAKADALVSKAEVSIRVSSERLATDRQVVESNAIAIADVRLSHRADITKFKKIVLALLAELDEQTANSELFSKLGEMLRSENETGADRLNDIYRKVIATPGRIDSIKKLAESLRILIALEREAWGIGDGDGQTKTDISELIAELQGRGLRL